MAKDKIYVPSSGGGLIRYFDEYKTKLEISPQTVLILIIITVVIVTFLHIFKPFG